jgi:hypothetical protein
MEPKTLLPCSQQPTAGHIWSWLNEPFTPSYPILKKVFSSHLRLCLISCLFQTSELRVVTILHLARGDSLYTEVRGIFRKLMDTSAKERSSCQRTREWSRLCYVEVKIHGYLTFGVNRAPFWTWTECLQSNPGPQLHWELLRFMFILLLLQSVPFNSEPDMTACEAASLVPTRRVSWNFPSFGI